MSAKIAELAIVYKLDKRLENWCSILFLMLREDYTVSYFYEHWTWNFHFIPVQQVQLEYLVFPQLGCDHLVPTKEHHIIPNLQSKTWNQTIHERPGELLQSGILKWPPWLPMSFHTSKYYCGTGDILRIYIIYRTYLSVHKWLWDTWVCTNLYD